MTALSMYMMSQDFSGDIYWTVVDSGDNPAITKAIVGAVNQGKINVDFIKAKQRPNGLISALANLTTALSRARIDCVYANADDDDYYEPNWLSSVYDRLMSFSIVGQAPATYYNVLNRTWQLQENIFHSSFSGMGFTKDVIPLILHGCDTHQPWLDKYVWENWDGSSSLTDDQLVLGIKGMYPGIEVTHTLDYVFKNNDPDLDYLRSRVGKLADMYATFKDGENYLPF